jgi:hypothetical protein
MRKRGGRLRAAFFFCQNAISSPKAFLETIESSLICRRGRQSASATGGIAPLGGQVSKLHGDEAIDWLVSSLSGAQIRVRLRLLVCRLPTPRHAQPEFAVSFARSSLSDSGALLNLLLKEITFISMTLT